MPFEIHITREFSAAHQLRLYDEILEPLHGHNWQVRVSVAAEKLDRIGVVMDFHELERIVDAVIGPMHNRNLNEMPEFASQNPSAENIALHMAQSLALPSHIKLLAVAVWETSQCCAVWKVSGEA
jgi:6-pyruvoyltetrahydropterin/6-carboxytetrahydropterin synthase